MKPIPTETATDVGSVGKWLGAAAAGALLMYLLDPERGSARRSRAVSALRSAGARTGATVDHALHSAGDRLAGLKDSAAGALSRGAGRLQAGAASGMEWARHGSHEAARRAEQAADRARVRARERADGWRHDSHENSYEASQDYASGAGSSGGLGQWLRGLTGRQEVRTDTMRESTRDAGPHPALVGGGMLGLLSLMRRSPGGLLVGLAALALLMKSSRSRTYRVTDNMAMPRAHARDAEQQGQAPMIPPPGESGNRYLH
jgi:hypothetical protein